MESIIFIWFYFCCWARDDCATAILTIYHFLQCVHWDAAAVYLWCVDHSCFFVRYSKIERFVGFMFHANQQGFFQLLLCLCSQIAVCPHPIGRVYNRDIAWYQKWICISNCIYVYLCVFIYLYVRINRWLYVRVFRLSQNENINKAVLWIIVYKEDVL